MSPGTQERKLYGYFLEEYGHRPLQKLCAFGAHCFRNLPPFIHNQCLGHKAYYEHCKNQNTCTGIQLQHNPSSNYNRLKQSLLIIILPRPSPPLWPFHTMWNLSSETISDSTSSVMQDCKYILSHLLPVCNLLVQDQKITYNCQDGFKFYCGVLVDFRSC